MSTAPVIITQKMLFEKLSIVEEKLDRILSKEAEHSIEEISLYKASKKLHLSQDTVIDLVKKGKLEARTYKDSNKKTRYRFKISDIHKFQQKGKYDHVSLHAEDFETAEEIADRIFKNRSRRV